MMSNSQCPKCGRELLGETGSPMCAACLLEAGMKSNGEVTTPFSSKYDSKFTAPGIAELAGHFPQLEILELLGQGGMGAVYKAKQSRLDRVVALKILPKTAGQEAEFTNRFAREAKTMARLGHPNIVAIHDYGEAGGWYFFIMEYIDGVNLRQAIQARSIEPKNALAMVGQVCDALQYAHEEGVVHRDIKPENILLDKRGRVKIADFGLAKLLGQVTVHDRLTHTHQVMGTVGYMAPEQLEGSKEVDHRADLYALGVVFYELLTHELPLGRFAPPSQKVQVDVRIDEVVLKTLEKEPQRRYQHASEIKQDVERISLGADPGASKAPFAVPTSVNLTHSMPWLLKPSAAGVALLVLGALEFGIFFMGMLQMSELHLSYSETSKMWMFFTMADLLAGLAVAVAGLLILWRRFWLLAVLGAIVAIVPLAQGASLMRPVSQEMTLAQLVQLAEKQGIKINASRTEEMGYSFEARQMRDKILNMMDSPGARIDQLIYLRWPTILVTWLSIPVGIWALMLLFQPAVRAAFKPWFSMVSRSESTGNSRTEIQGQPVPQDQSLLLGFHALIAVVTLGLGAAFTVWPCSALVTGQSLRMPFGGANNAAWIFAPIGMGFLWFGIKMYIEVMHVISLRGMERTLRIQLGVMGLVLSTVGLVVALNAFRAMQAEESLSLVFSSIISNGSEVAGWLFGFFVGGGMAILLAIAPFNRQSLRRAFKWFIVILIVAIAIAFFVMPTSVQTYR